MKEVSESIKGMVVDLHPMEMEDGSYAFCLNGTILNFDGNGLPIVQNDGSNILGIRFPDGYIVVGNKNIIEQNRILWFLYNPETEDSQIGESLYKQNIRQHANDFIGLNVCDDCEFTNIEQTPLEKRVQLPLLTYHTIQIDECFNFSNLYPVKSIVYKIIPCGIEVHFEDYNNPMRYIIFQYVSDDETKNLIIKQSFYEIIGYTDDDCQSPIYGTDIDCNKLSIQPNIDIPCIEFSNLIDGGSVLAGSYQFFISYGDDKSNNLSPWFGSTNIIPVKSRTITVDTDYQTNKAIVLNINNIDLPAAPFQYYNLAVAKTINNFTTFYFVGTFPIVQKTYIYTGSENTERKLDPTEIFAKPVYYKTAALLTTSNDILFRGKLKEYIQPNFQRIANNIILYWQTMAIPEGLYRDPSVSNKFKGCMRDEVYPYGIRFHFTNGQISNVYHIPGRDSEDSDLVTLLNDDVFRSTGCAVGPLPKGGGDSQPLPRWLIYNTATIEGGELNIFDGCNESCYQYGKMAFWESRETYPNNPEIWGDLCGKKIRHHKFPDSTVTHIHNNQDGDPDESYLNNNIIFPIGVKVDVESVSTAIADGINDGFITSEDAARIVGYSIVRGNRYKNKSIIAKGLIFDVNQYKRIDSSDGDHVVKIDAEPILFANYPYNDLRDNGFLTDDFKNYQFHNTPQGEDLPFTDSQRYTFHSPDTHFNQPEAGSELKLETVEYGQSEGYFTVSKDQAKQKLLSDASYALALTGGIVAALLKTVQPEESSYTIRGIDLSALGVAAGSYGPTITPPIGPQALWYEQNTGIGLPAIIPMSTIERKTIKGTRKQFFAPTSVAAFPDEAPALVLLDGVGGLIGFLNSSADFIRIVLEEMNLLLDVIKAFAPDRDWCVQYNSVGKYNNFSVVENDGGYKRRVLSASAYLDPTNQYVNEEVDPTTGQFSSIKFNNLNRESSLYLKYSGNPFLTAGDDTFGGHVDVSRARMSEADCRLDYKIYKNISSFYASIKNSQPSQYGSVYNIEYILTESCYYKMNERPEECRTVWGGDTFINRFALKIKVPYFLNTTFGLPDDVDFDFSGQTNLAFPRMYYNNTGTIGSEFSDIGDIFNIEALIDNLGRPKSIRDCSTSKFFYQNGYIYLYHYGLPYFLVESDINVDMRHGENVLEKDFYPNQSDLDFWLQEINVPIKEDNYYFYNNSYSKQNKETSLAVDGPDFIPNKECLEDDRNRIIYSDNINWLVYKANNFLNYPLNRGKLTGIDGIENNAVMIRTENTTAVFKSILRFPVNGQTLQVGDGGLFSNPPQQLAETTLGHVGSQHVQCMHTEFGHIFVDAKRGKIFSIGPDGSDTDLSKQGWEMWFAQNLPFNILRSFSNIPVEDIDNNFNGLGIAMSFDKINKRIFITKLDYKLKDKKNTDNIVYDPVTKKFMKGSSEVFLKSKYFVDCSWTVSFSFLSKSWVCPHSFIPNYYVDSVEFFGAGLNSDNSFWLHNVINSSYQVYFGKLYPFIIEPFFKFSGVVNCLKSIEYDNEVRRYTSDYDYISLYDKPGFNKAVIYNENYNTGLLNLIKTNKSDQTLTGKYPIRGFGYWDIEIAIANNKWRFNQFYNLLREGSTIPQWKYKGNNIEKNLNANAFNYNKNPFDLSRLRGEWFKLRLINDSDSNHKILYKFTTANEVKTFR